MPLPLLILIPIIGLAGAWWYERQKSAAAAALPGAIAAAAASQPASGAPASAIWIHPSGAIMSSTPGGALGSLVLTPVGTGALQAMAAALNASIANEASNLLSQIPGHLPGDAYDLNRQVIVISSPAAHCRSEQGEAPADHQHADPEQDADGGRCRQPAQGF